MSEKLNTHFLDVDKAVILANRNRPVDDQYTRRTFMEELGKHHQKATDWKAKTPEIISVAVKMRDLAGVKSIDELLTPVENKNKLNTK